MPAGAVGAVREAACLGRGALVLRRRRVGCGARRCAGRLAGLHLDPRLLEHLTVARQRGLVALLLRIQPCRVINASQGDHHRRGSQSRAAGLACSCDTTAYLIDYLAACGNISSAAPEAKQRTVANVMKAIPLKRPLSGKRIKSRSAISPQ